MQITDELLSAHADGELDADTARALEQALASDPVAAARLEAFRRVREQLFAAHQGILDKPAPDRLIEAAQAERSKTVFQFAGNRKPARAAVFAQPWPRWAAIAATFVVGVIAGPTLGLTQRSSEVVMSDGGLVAAGSLAEGLSTPLAGNGAGPVEVAFTFASADGVCRTFHTSARLNAAGVACRRGGTWQIKAIEEAPAVDDSEYRMAASQLPSSLLAVVDGMIVGEPYSSGQESAARASGWQQ